MNKIQAILLNLISPGAVLETECRKRVTLLEWKCMTTIPPCEPLLYAKVLLMKQTGYRPSL
jgi:hypothetical protein